MPPGEGAQEGAERGGGAHLLAENGPGRTRAQKSGVIDAVTPGQGGEDEGHPFRTGVARTGSTPQIYVLTDEVPQPELLGEGGGQEKTGVGHGVTIRKGY